MKKIIILLVAVAMVACNPTSKLSTYQSEGDAAFEQADYATAYAQYTQYITVASANGVDISDELYIKQAQACAQLDKVDEASELYNTLLAKGDHTKLLAEYSQMLQANGRVDDELALWNSYADKVSTPELKNMMTERLIFLNESKGNNQALIDVVANKPADVKLSKEAQLSHIKALEAEKKGYPAAKACNQLLKAYPNYIEALEWKAKYYYEKAENRYKYEMAKYNKNKNATTYAYLRRDLKKVSSDFRIARDVFLQLRKHDPKNKSYIRYLKNTYLRLDQKSEAVQLDKLL